MDTNSNEFKMEPSQIYVMAKSV